MIRLNNAATGTEMFQYRWDAGPLGQDVSGGTVDITHGKGKYAVNVVARFAYNTPATEDNSVSYQPGRGTIVWPTAFDGYNWQNLDMNTIRFNSRSPAGGNAGTWVSILINIMLPWQNQSFLKKNMRKDEKIKRRDSVFLPFLFFRRPSGGWPSQQ